MDIKNLLCNTTTTTTDNDFNTTMMVVEKGNEKQYEKLVFEYYSSINAPASPPSSISSWSSASSVSSNNDTIFGSFSPILSPVVTAAKTTKQHQTRTPWTASEDYLLKKGYLQGLSWAMISSRYLPHRSRGCCWGRFKTLQTKSSNEKKNWTESEDRILIGAIKKHTILFKQAWRSVALDLNNRDWRECEIRSARISGLLIDQHKHQSPLS